MQLSTQHRDLLAAIIDRIVPADQDPSGIGFAADRYIIAQMASVPAEHESGITDVLDAVDRNALARHGLGFAALSAADQDVILAGFAGEGWFQALCEVTAEGVYADPDNGGNPGAASWAMVGYRHGLPEGPNGPPKIEAKRPRPYEAGLTDYDVIIVGAGAGGGVAAGVLAEAGKRVLLLERGIERSYADGGHRDHLRNHRLARHGHNTGPDLDGNPRVVVDADGTERVVRPHENAYQNIATGVGSGTFVYGAQAWRFHPDDFRMASRYGVPEGSSLVDWPFGYDELAPFYEQAEQEIGVAGTSGSNPHEGARRLPFPMPALPPNGGTAALQRGAAQLGLATFPPPLLINSLPRDGRGACIGCGSCVGFPCPTDAKNGTQNTMIKRALASGNCTLVTGAMVLKVETGSDGKVQGVSFADAEERLHTVRAKAVVLAGGAIETARLLLNSATDREPEGLGNAHDLVGRNLQGHVYPTAFGLFDETVHGSRGPGVTIATTDFNHGNPGVIGGAMLADDFVMPPILFWKSSLPPDLQRWGRPAKDFMRNHFGHVLQVKGPVQEIPDPNSRVTVAKNVRDRWDLPVARLSGTVHAETLRTAHFMFDRATDWIRASGAQKAWGRAPQPHLSGGQHQAGTCRMGSDPASSVTDAYGRVWGHDNLFVCDGALHPTNGGFNPVLTIMALAFRNGAQIATEI